MTDEHDHPLTFKDLRERARLQVSLALQWAKLYEARGYSVTAQGWRDAAEAFRRAERNLAGA